MRLYDFFKFNFEKIYFDCVDNSGNCFIIYWAKLQYFFIKIQYSGLIFSDFENITIEKSSFKKINKPSIKNNLCFNNNQIEISGSWEKKDESINLLLYKDAWEKELLWNCHHPSAITEIKYKNKTYNGYGYSETLLLPIKPWNLPINELRWGRFLSANYTIIWLNWKGKYPLNILFCNGIRYEDAFFENESIYFDNRKYFINFNRIFVLRERKLSKILSKMSFLKILFNNRILNTKEIKYKAKTTLYNNLNIISEGWSIYEIVLWKN